MFFRLNIFAEEEVKNEQAHRIQFTYDGRGFLSEVIDSVGRRLEVTTNELGRMTEVALLDGIRREVLVRYAYNKAQDLVDIQDALGQSTKILYRNHLMAQKIDRNQNSFYWRYDGPTTGARVIKTWGDGNGECSVYNDGFGLLQQAYHWNVNHRLKPMVIELIAGKTTPINSFDN